MKMFVMLPFLIREDDDGGSPETFLRKRPICSLCDTGQTMRDKIYSIYVYGHILCAALRLNICGYSYRSDSLARCCSCQSNKSHPL